MRVEVMEALPEQDKAAFRAFSDAAVERALKNFAGATNAEDSLFVADADGVLTGGSNSSANVCVGTITLRFRDETLAGNRARYFTLLEKMSELLKQAGSAESLRATLSISGAGSDVNQLTLRMRLESVGNSPEQAALRWGLGLAHVQQALLFTSRSLRQQLRPGQD